MENLDQMSFSNLESLRTFAREQWALHKKAKRIRDAARWSHHIAVIQQHINKKTAAYFNEL